MKKYTYLGIGNNRESCCILESLADFDTLANNVPDIEESDFVHSSTNWNGNDLIERTCKMQSLHLTDRIIKLETPLVFTGFDYDMGHEYGWEFTVYYIHEVRNMRTKVYGYSDDLVEIEGAKYPNNEIDCFMKDVIIDFKDGTKVRVGYPKKEGAIWWIEVLIHGTADYILDYCYDQDCTRYSDVFQINSEVSSVKVVNKKD